MSWSRASESSHVVGDGRRDSWKPVISEAVTAWVDPEYNVWLRASKTPHVVLFGVQWRVLRTVGLITEAVTVLVEP